MLLRKLDQKLLEKKHVTYPWQTGCFIKSKIENCKKFLENVQKLIILKVRKIRLLSPFKKNLETKIQQVGRGGGVILPLPAENWVK